MYYLCTSRLRINEAEEKTRRTQNKIIRQNSIEYIMTLKIFFLFVLSSDFVYKIFAGVGDHWNYEDYG
jgi:hypothetical protein